MQKMAHVDQKFCPCHSVCMSETRHHMIVIYMLHMCKMIIGLLLFFQNFVFFGLLGGKRGKDGPK